MSSKEEVKFFLEELRAKISVFGILFRDDRGKNQQTLYELEISPSSRKDIIGSLKIENYCEGPLMEKLYNLLPMWIFGTNINQREIYIKISLGIYNNSAVCISFHFAEHPLNYPFKN